MAKRNAFTGNKSKSGGSLGGTSGGVSGGGSASASSSNTKTGGVLGGSSTATTSTQSGTRTKTSTQQSGGSTPVTPQSPYTGAGASNLSQYYSGMGSRLGGTVQQRFSDPNFASAAQRAGITQQQYTINPGNAKYNQSILAQLKAGGTQANPLVETVQNNTTTTPTVGEALQGTENTRPQYEDISYQFGADPNAEVMGYYKSLADQRVDENKIRRDVLNQFQGRIQATNQVYDQLLSQARKQGQGEVGAGTALLAARGLAGSARGQAIAGGIEQQNLEREQGVEAQRLNQIAEIQNQAYALAQEAIAQKQAAKNQGYAAYVDFLSKDQERKAKLKDNFVASLIYGGKDINNLNPKQLSDIAKQLGSSADEIRTTYDILKSQQEAQNAEEQAFTLSEGQARYVQDPKTGEWVQVAQRGKTYKGGGGGGSGGGSGALSAISGTSSGGSSSSALSDAVAFLSPNMAKNEREAFMKSYNQFAKSGNTKAIEELIFKTAVNQLPDAGTKANITKKRSIFNQVGEIGQLLDQYYADGGDTSLFIGKTQNIRAKLGKVKDPELYKIGQRITFLVDELGKAQSGAALNANEEALYRSLFPSAGKTAGLNTADVQALRDALRSGIEGTIGIALGSSGVEQISGTVFGDTAQPTTTSGGATKLIGGKPYKKVNGGWIPA